MVVFPHAKINIGLNVVGKRDDGYHNIETVFYPIALCDVLEAVVAERQKPGMRFTVSGLEVGGSPEENLCVKAYHLLAKNHDLPAVDMHLHKAIPIGAGLGGGSADAAFALNLLDSLCGLGLSMKEKLACAQELGSDCAFFLIGKPCFATGRGEDLQPIPVLLHGYHLVLVCPGISISTAEAYKKIRPAIPRSALLSSVTSEPVEEWAATVANQFEQVVFPEKPEVAGIKEKLISLGASFASMSGSGSAVYGFFRELPDLSSFKGQVIYTEAL